jgi:hypothetical protein
MSNGSPLTGWAIAESLLDSNGSKQSFDSTGSLAGVVRSEFLSSPELARYVREIYANAPYGVSQGIYTGGPAGLTFDRPLDLHFVNVRALSYGISKETDGGAWVTLILTGSVSFSPVAVSQSALSSPDSTSRTEAWLGMVDNLGYALQQQGLVHPYTWTLTLEDRIPDPAPPPPIPIAPPPVPPPAPPPTNIGLLPPPVPIPGPPPPPTSGGPVTGTSNYRQRALGYVPLGSPFVVTIGGTNINNNPNLPYEDFQIIARNPFTGTYVIFNYDTTSLGNPGSTYVYSVIVWSRTLGSRSQTYVESVPYFSSYAQNPFAQFDYNLQ